MTDAVPPGSVPPGSVAVALGCERGVLLPERALWLPQHNAVLVADLHWGKAAAFRAAHVPVPSGTTASDLARLGRVLTATRATRLVVLGDLLHAREGRHPATLATIATWRASHAAVQVELVRGNHDVHAGDPPEALEVTVHDGPLAIGGVVGVHDVDRDGAGAVGSASEGTIDGVAPGAGAGASRFVVSGHLHPSVVLRGAGRQRVRLPCFVVGVHRAVLPAFTRFTGGGHYTPVPGDAWYAVVEGDGGAAEIGEAAEGAEVIAAGGWGPYAGGRGVTG